MRAGGGKDKGSAFERETGKALSLWLTAGERPDIFSRNVLSGGAWTNAHAAGKVSSRMPGDLMAAHPLAFRFLERFLVECKHLQSLELERYLFDLAGSSKMARIVALAEHQATTSNLQYMIIAKQNLRDAMVLIDGPTATSMLALIRTARRLPYLPPYHFLHQQRVCLMRFEHMTRWVNPQFLLAEKAST